MIKFFCIILAIHWTIGFPFAQNCELMDTDVHVIGTPVLIQIKCDQNIGQNYFWKMGNGDSVSSDNIPFVSYDYKSVGEYQVNVVMTLPDGVRNFFHTVQQVINPPNKKRAQNSTSILFDPLEQKVWTVNRDNNSVIVMSSLNYLRSKEIPVGKKPRTLALDGQGRVWVVNQESWDISLINTTTGKVVGNIKLPYASQPYGIVIDTLQNLAYVSLKALDKIVKINTITQSVEGEAFISANTRDLALSHDGKQLYVSKYISVGLEGKIFEVNSSSLEITRTFTLPFDTSTDGSSSGGGVVNAVNSLVITPDGTRLIYNAKKDNIHRGPLFGTEELNHENTLRTISGIIDIASGIENQANRIDYNDRCLANSSVINKLGTLLFSSTECSNTIEITNLLTNNHIGSIDPDSLETELAPQGLALSENDSLLYVLYYTSREIAVYDVSTAGEANKFTLIKKIKSVDSEILSPGVLLGKQVFYNARDKRMSLESYITCSGCHLDGGHDGQSYDRSSRSEGLRNTTSLLGKAGLGHGPLFWTANSDELQDSEGGIRSVNQGVGFISDSEFDAGNRKDKLGDPIAGLSPELDALAEFLSSLTEAPLSPFRNSDGTMTASALLGKELFESKEVGCSECHNGPNTTISNFADNKLFDVGTFTVKSGLSMGKPLTGLDVPTINGVWNTAPYLHDGSANTLMDVLTTKNPEDKHGKTSHLNSAELIQLVEYMRQANSPVNQSEIPSRKVKVGVSYSFRKLPEGWELNVLSRQKPIVSVFTISGKEIDVARKNNFYKMGKSWKGMISNSVFKQNQILILKGVVDGDIFYQKIFK